MKKEHGTYIKGYISEPIRVAYYKDVIRFLLKVKGVDGVEVKDDSAESHKQVIDMLLEVV